jgi:hypothetical protein
MEIMRFDDIYQKTSKVITIDDYSYFFSDKKKSQAPLYGAFVSSDNTRKVQSILYRTALTIDIDGLKGNDEVAKRFIVRVIEYLKSNFSTFVFHETHSSKKDDRRFRILIPIGKISKDNFKYFAQAFCEDFMSMTKTKDYIVLDKKSYEPQQLMYFIPSYKFNYIYGSLEDKNSIEQFLPRAKELKDQDIKPEKANQEAKKYLGGGFYDWLSAKGMTYFVDKYFADTYKFNRILGDGQFEYKDLSSKKKAGIRITANNQVMTTWHDGDIYTNQGNGARSANIYQLLKNKGIANDVFEEYRREVA